MVENGRRPKRLKWQSNKLDSGTSLEQRRQEDTVSGMDRVECGGPQPRIDNAGI